MAYGSSRQNGELPVWGIVVFVIVIIAIGAMVGLGLLLLASGKL